MANETLYDQFYKTKTPRIKYSTEEYRFNENLNSSRPKEEKPLTTSAQKTQNSYVTPLGPNEEKPLTTSEQRTQESYVTPLGPNEEKPLTTSAQRAQNSYERMRA